MAFTLSWVLQSDPVWTCGVPLCPGCSSQIPCGLVISDPVTGYWMALEAFGTDNRRVFAEILQRANSLELIASVAESAE